MECCKWCKDFLYLSILYRVSVPYQPLGWVMSERSVSYRLLLPFGFLPRRLFLFASVFVFPFACLAPFFVCKQDTLCVQCVFRFCCKSCKALLFYLLAFFSFLRVAFLLLYVSMSFTSPIWIACLVSHSASAICSYDRHSRRAMSRLLFCGVIGKPDCRIALSVVSLIFIGALQWVYISCFVDALVALLCT